MKGILEFISKHSSDLSPETKERLLAKASAAESFPFVEGDKVLIRTVTHIQTGKVASMCGSFVELRDAAWIADTGRFSECIHDGTFSEVEAVNTPVWVNIKSIIDVYPFNHSLPRETK